MDNILGTLSNLRVDTVLSSIDKVVPGASTKIKNVADKAMAYVNNVSELELKVLEATNHEPWGPHGSVMQEITQCAFNGEGLDQIMGVCDQRLSESADNWRLVYKALLLLEYMCKHGPMAVPEALLSYSRISHLERLRDRFEYKDPAGRDQGVNVRQRAGAIVTLLQDRDKLAEERDKAQKNRAKYTGVSSGSSGRYGGFSGGSGYGSGGAASNSYGGYGGGSGGFRDAYGSSSSSSAATPAWEASRGSSSSAAPRGGRGSDSGLGAAAAAGEPADPVEATRARIARLKEQGALGAGGGPGSDGGHPTLEDPGSPGKKPKKLSDIRINPAISATFAKGGLAPPPGAGARGAGAGAAAAAANPIDLLGDLDAPAAPAAAAAAAAPGAPGDEWDSFTAAPQPAAGTPAAAAGAGGDEWAAFEAAPGSRVPQQKPAIDINTLLGPIPSSAPAGSGGKAPLPLGDFSSLPAAGPPGPGFAALPAGQAAAAGAGGDPFGAFVASPPAAAPAPAAAGPGGFGDPFAASGAVGMVPHAAKQHAPTGPKLGPETAKAKDPFADLLG